MKYDVFMISDAEEDVVELCQYISAFDSAEKAEAVFDRLKEACAGLSEFPDRGHVPPELDRIGIVEFREIHFKPYRIIYQIAGSKVMIHCILDGRRELQELLEKRLLR